MENERLESIELLSELRAKYNCFDEKEEPYYRALSLAIASIKESDDCVSRKEVFETFGELLGTWGTQALMEMPSVTPVRKKGKWIIDDEELGRIWHCHCSNCKKDPQDYIGGTENWWLVRLPDYCPNCGIKMESEE